MRDALRGFFKPLRAAAAFRALLRVMRKREGMKKQERFPIAPIIRLGNAGYPYSSTLLALTKPSILAS
jgi:hypothetical protein